MTPRDPGLDPALDPKSLSDDEWRALLQEHEYHVLRQAGTERAFSGPHLDNEASGAYHCVGCGARLYDAEHKFHSGCGWPSFFSEIEAGAITLVRDASHGMERTEMRCARCDGHLGHVFDDAPQQPTGKRHCVNGVALLFVASSNDPKEALGRHRRRTPGD